MNIYFFLTEFKGTKIKDNTSTFFQYIVSDTTFKIKLIFGVPLL